MHSNHWTASEIIHGNADWSSVCHSVQQLSVSGSTFSRKMHAAKIYALLRSAVLLESHLDLVVAGSDTAVLMVESEAKELPEVVRLDAVQAGHKAMQPVIKMINEFAKEASKDFKVAITGEGGDELFGGYGRYKARIFKNRTFFKPAFRRFKNFSKDHWRFDNSRDII